jgi:type VI secretion system FHA domain protein
MLLTLEVVSPNGESLGANRRRTVGPDGIQIGRSKENDWVIPDPYISRTHARVRYVNGAFYIEGLGRNPLAINDAANVIPNNEPQLLRNGDRVFLDEYEIRVTLGAQATSTATVEDPFSVAPSTAPLSEVEIRDALETDTGVLDPLAVLGGSSATTRPPQPPHVDLHAGSVLEENYQPPPIVAPAATAVPPPPSPRPAAAIPDTWDRTNMSEIKAAKPAVADDPFMKPSSGAARPVIPDVWDRTSFDARNASAPPPPQPQRPAIAPTPPPAPPPRPAPASHTVRRPDPVRIDPVQVEPVAPAVPPAPPIAASAFDATGRYAAARTTLEELLRAAGLPDAQMTPEIAAEIGEVLRIVVEGLMEVLRARAEIKSQMRMSMTRMQSTENNPLKFSPNVEAALHTLLVERNRGYLPTVQAFQEAMLDIRNHQMAVLAGIRAAFDNMLDTFDPGRIEAEIERQAKRSLLNVGTKSRFRDHYVDEFARLTRDRDKAFEQLFGERFAEAYEEQMERLKALSRSTKQ